MTTRWPRSDSSTSREDNMNINDYGNNNRDNSNGIHVKDTSAAAPAAAPGANSNNNNNNKSNDVSLIDALTSYTHNLMNIILPRSRQQAIYTFVLAHPLLTTFLVCQIFCSALPVCLFLAGVALSAAVAATVFSCLALFVFVPAVAVTTSLAVLLWVWVWCVVLVVRWSGRKYGVEFGLEFAGRKGSSPSGMGEGEKKEDYHDHSKEGVVKVEEL